MRNETPEQRERRLFMHRKRNREYYERQRAIKGTRTAVQVREEQKVRRERRQHELIMFAEREGHVPSNYEASDILGYSTGLGRGASTYIQEMRREAFGIRKMGRTETAPGFRIPYPVPEEYRCDDS